MAGRRETFKDAVNPVSRLVNTWRADQEYELEVRFGTICAQTSRFRAGTNAQTHTDILRRLESFRDWDATTPWSAIEDTYFYVDAHSTDGGGGGDSDRGRRRQCRMRSQCSSSVDKDPTWETTYCFIDNTETLRVDLKAHTLVDHGTGGGGGSGTGGGEGPSSFAQYAGQFQSARCYDVRAALKRERPVVDPETLFGDVIVDPTWVRLQQRRTFRTGAYEFAVYRAWGAKTHEMAEIAQRVDNPAYHFECELLHTAADQTQNTPDRYVALALLLKIDDFQPAPKVYKPVSGAM